MTPTAPTQQRSPALEKTARWIERLVIGEKLCPFAAAPWHGERVRLVESAARTPQLLVQDLAQECGTLLQTTDTPTQIETTVIVHPHVLTDFAEYNDFLSVADEVLVEIGAEGVLQVASFHPDYCFADAPQDDPANCSNRSPYPMLHVLREDSLSKAVDSYSDVDDIPERNIAHLRALGMAEIQRRLADDG